MARSMTWLHTLVSAEYPVIYVERFAFPETRAAIKILLRNGLVIHRKDQSQPYLEVTSLGLGFHDRYHLTEPALQKTLLKELYLKPHESS